MNLSNEVKHLVARTYGDEVIQRSMRAKCRVLAQLKFNSPVIRMCSVRHISMVDAGYIANPFLVKFIWRQTIVLVKLAFDCDTDALVLGAPDVVLHPRFYQAE